MYFSSYQYYYCSTLYRFLFQKHNGVVSYVSGISVQVANTDGESVEDIEVLHALRSMEEVCGQKSVLKYSGSRYVGTTKKAYYLSVLNVRKELVFFVLESLSMFFMSNFQKRFGRFEASSVQRTSFAICCKDLQIFQNYYFSFLKSNFLINFYAVRGSAMCLLDELQCYKFNIKQ